MTALGPCMKIDFHNEKGANKYFVILSTGKTDAYGWCKENINKYIPVFPCEAELYVAPEIQ